MIIIYDKIYDSVIIIRKLSYYVHNQLVTVLFCLPILLVKYLSAAAGDRYIVLDHPFGMHFVFLLADTLIIYHVQLKFVR